MSVDRQHTEALAAIENARRAAGRWVSATALAEDDLEHQRARHAKGWLDDLMASVDRRRRGRTADDRAVA